MPSTELVERVKSETWTNRDGEFVTSYKVTLVSEIGQREIPCYSPLGKDLKEDAPLPDGWEVKTSQKGKLYLAAPRPGSDRPGAGGGGFQRQAAWANTEEGEKYVQERMDRRTALMQAAAVYEAGIRAGEHVLELEGYADRLYTWLRKNLDVGAGGGPRDSAPRNPNSTVPPAPTPLDGGGVEPGEASSPSSTKRSHAAKWTPNQPPKGWQ